MADSPEEKKNVEKGAKPKKSWLFFSRGLAENTSQVWLTVLAILMVVIIFTIVILASLGLLPHIGDGTSSLSSSSQSL